LFSNTVNPHSSPTVTDEASDSYKTRSPS
jgi:hypothetical protein